jgi:isoleucyl-tRNA synthetase
MSWNAVLPKHDCKKQKADLYLEGLDQFSGWFYSSLLTSIGAQEDSPYKSIFVHGFTLDEKGRKMSKSLGNVIAPCQITQGIKPNGKIGTIFGVDVLRYWVGAHACQSSSIPVGEDLMKQTKQEVDRLRNALRYIIGNINDEATKKDIFALPYHEMTLVDQYMLHILWKYRSTLTDCFETMAFNQVCQVTQNFVANDLSSFYFMLVKDRLYCDAQESLGRKSAVTVMLKLGQYMTKLLSPIVPVLIEEIAQHCPELGIDLAEKLEDVSDGEGLKKIKNAC